MLHFNQASLEGYAAAQYELALCFRQGRGGVAQDFKEAARLFKQAAEKGHIGAQFSIARCYRVGEGVPPGDFQAAVTWLRRDMDQEIKSPMTESQCYLRAAACFEQGKAGVEQDSKEAHGLYELYVSSVCHHRYRTLMTSCLTLESLIFMAGGWSEM